MKNQQKSNYLSFMSYSLSRTLVTVVSIVVGTLGLSFQVSADPTFVNAANPALPAQARGVPKGGALRVFGLNVEGAGETTLKLQRFDAFTSDVKILVDYKNEIPAPTTAYFRGRADFDPASVVMLVIPEKGVPHGIIKSQHGAWRVHGKLRAPGLSARLVDIETETAGRDLGCGVDMMLLTEPPITSDGNILRLDAGQSESGLTGTNVQYTAHMIVDTDFEFYQNFGDSRAALEYIGDVFAWTSTVYEREINTNIKISLARLFTTNHDPYTAMVSGCDGEGALDEVQDEWSGDSTPRTLVHLLSGKNVGAGCAYTGDNYVGVLCSQANGYGASMGIGTTFNIDDPLPLIWDSMVVSHEIGHNFSSPHSHNYCNVDGEPLPIDNCVVSGAPDNVGDSCYNSDPPALPGPGSLTGGSANSQNGTLMSYCHQRTGGIGGNFAWTFGMHHPDGIAPWRESDMMRLAAVNAAACMTLDYEGTDLQVFKDCKPDDPMLVGDTAVCNIDVVNAGPHVALGVTAVDEYLSNGTFSFGAITVTRGDTVITPTPCTTTTDPQTLEGTVTCDLGDIAAGVEHAARISIEVTADEPQNINDRVTVFSDSPDPDMNNNVAEDEVNIIANADLAVSKICKPDTGPGLVGSGNSEICTIWVDNLGPSDAEGVLLVDELVSNGQFSASATGCTGGPGTLNCNIGSLAAGDRREFSVVITVPTSTGEANIDVNDVASVSSSVNDADTTNNSATAGVSFQPNADLALTKSAPAAATAGTTFTYTLGVTNNGPSSAPNVVISDSLPAGVSIVSVTAGGASCDWGTPGDASLPTTCAFGTLGVSASGSMQIEVLVDPDLADGTVLGNNAEVSSAILDTDNTNNLASTSTTVGVVADLSVSKSDTPDPVLAGAELTYILTVTNTGPSIAHDVELVDTLPPGVTFVVGEDANGNSVCTESSGTVTCAIGDMGVDSTVQRWIKVYVLPSVPDGTILTNTVVVSSSSLDDDPSNNSASEDTTVRTEADLWIDKTGNTLTSNSSGTLEYQLTVHNDPGCSGDDQQVCGDGGPSDALNVVVVDTLPLDPQKLRVEFVSEDCLYDQASHTVRCTTAVLPAGSSVVHIIQMDLKGNSDLLNTATVTSDTADPDTVNNTDELLMSVKGGKGNPNNPR